MKKAILIVLALVVVIVLAVVLWEKIEERRGPEPGTVLDEAKQAGLEAADLPGSAEDYMADMDYGITKDPEAVRAALDRWVPGISAEEAVERVVRGRNNWNVWTAGNDPLWDQLSVATFGGLDLLKTISNHPNLDFSRDSRWEYLGVVNEPCFEKGEGPREDRFGLWLDVRSEGCPPDPFEDEAKYPGVKVGARGRSPELPVGSYYGYATGVLGLRLFPNPAFDEAAQERWDPEAYYTEPDYYNDENLVKPYRVGMSCGFCHIGPNPTNPPADPENPEFANLNSNPGAQYFWFERIFMYEEDQGNFIWQLLHASRPGALDTSLVSSDQITNPRTMNAIYNLGARLEVARRWGRETLAGGGLDNAQFNDYLPAGSPLTAYFEAPDQVRTPHVLKDGADSVGALGALNRVFVNIGLFSEEWTLHFKPVIGGTRFRPITPFPIATARKNSTYWNANELQTPDTALFFLATARPDSLREAPGGPAYLAADEAQLTRGKEVFAERCARCHSSKQPDKAFAEFFPPGSIGENYLTHWDDWWRWTKTDEYRGLIREIVLAPDFLEDNFLSTELRVPVTLLETNACSPLATNAIEGNIWDNFSSQSYKSLPSVGTITVHHPLTAEPYDYEMPAGGRGYTRPASLVSLWATAPYLLNNSVGEFYWTGSVEDRMKAFEDGITQMLWPERRKGNGRFLTASGKEAPGWIDKTTEDSYIKIAAGFVPPELQRLTGFFDRFVPDVFGGGGITLGPIPVGTPVNLLANVNLESRLTELVPLLLKIKKTYKRLPEDPEERREALRALVPDLLEVNKCRDFVVNRGHYFGTDFLPAEEREPGLSEEDKRALIELLKTF